MNCNNHFGKTKFKKILSDELPSRFKFESIIDDIQGFRIVLKEEGRSDAVRFIVKFEDIEQYVVSPKFPDKSGETFDPGNWSFFINSSESNLINRFHEETRDVYDDMVLFHYVILGVGNGVIEVLSQSEIEIYRFPGNRQIQLTVSD